MENEKVIGNVLLIDDDTTTNHVNKRVLVRSGLVGEVTTALNGQDALDMLTTMAGNPPELILLDLQMDGMNGFSFLESYAALPESSKAKVLVALTSSASFYDLTRLKEFPDVKDHIYKPFTIEHLQDLQKAYF